ncbi:MAG: hypothetical protein IJJ22_00625 [Oscillospiraceae bacterium]|nr:hypothetical protein [Oscillospiraceae bacterium]
MTAWKIYVGLNDTDSLKQEHDTDKYVNVLKNVCRSYHVPFSFTVAEGGYFHENGQYTQETTLIITLIGVDEEIAREIAKDLCAFFHQESVLITEYKVNAFFVNDKLK